MLIDLISATPLPEFHLDLVYKNGERRRFDMRPLLAMRPWSAIARDQQFEQVKVMHGSVLWPGEIDVAPETLYDDSVPLSP